MNSVEAIVADVFEMKSHIVVENFGNNAFYLDSLSGFSWSFRNSSKGIEL